MHEHVLNNPFRFRRAHMRTYRWQVYKIQFSYILFFINSHSRHTMTHHAHNCEHSMIVLCAPFLAFN